MQTLQIVLEKFSQKKLDIISVGHGLLSSLKRVKPAADDYGVKIVSPDFYEPEVVTDDDKTGYRYRSKILLKKRTGRNPEEVRDRLETVEFELLKKAETKGWRVCSTDMSTADPITSVVNGEPKIRPKLLLPEMNDKLIDQYFGGVLYDVDHIIRLVHDCVALHVLTEGAKRCHTLLYGPPACGKTSVLLKMRDLYNQEDHMLRQKEDANAELLDRVYVIDATAITKAGIIGNIADLHQRGDLASIIFIEEIEKCATAPDVLSFLLSVMDQRGRLTKKTARTDIDIETKILIWATCNDMDKFKDIHSGALFSRFTNIYQCKRPSIDLIKKILIREVKEIPGGNINWVDEALDIGQNIIKTTDPRVFISLLSGRDRLLTQKYRQDLERVYVEVNATEQESD